MDKDLDSQTVMCLNHFSNKCIMTLSHVVHNILNPLCLLVLHGHTSDLAGKGKVKQVN